MASLAEALAQALDGSFPRVSFAMAYGSGVFKQANHDASSSMIDLVFAVDDPVAWHADNIAHNPQHYSFMRHLGAANVASFQENYGAGVYYNTLVPLTGKLLGNRYIKYGVVSCKTLCEDLLDWKTLYLSGRMHKPVSILSSKDDITAASSVNLSHALHYALLCLPSKFTEHDLYMRIAGISYLGDFRMTFGENPKKVRNIVDGNFDAFREIYRGKINTSPYLVRSALDSDLLVSNNQEQLARRAIVDSLPSNLLGRLNNKYAEEVAQGSITKKHVQHVVASIVKRYSRSQSIKGIATAGGVKTFTYVAQKLQRTYLKTKK